MIKDNILSKFPEWYKDINRDRQYLILTNDFDSYFSCKTLNRLFGIEIGGYYSFDSGLWVNKEIAFGREPIFIDLSILEGKTFDNHFTFMKNPESINPNVNVSIYNRKFNGSALALICGLYDINLSKMTETNLTALLAIDGWYRGYYNKGGKYKDINIYWMNELGVTDYLLPILEAHDNQYFIDFSREYSLNEEIYIEDGYLQCTANILLPRFKFELVQPVTKKYMSKYEAQRLNTQDNNSIFTGAETYYNQYSISLRK